MKLVVVPLVLLPVLLWLVPSQSSAQTLGQLKGLPPHFHDGPERCPRDLNQAAAMGRECVKQCRSDHDCKSKRKKCLCDEVCGLSCIKPSFCGLPPKHSHARHNAPAEKMELELDTMVQYTCWPGYHARGFPRAKCVYHNGTAQWFGPDLQCEPIKCPDPGNVTNGVRNLTALTFTSKVTYMCKPGYVMEGKTDRYCQATKEWSGYMPTCRAIECNIPFDPANGKAIFSSTKYNSFVTYECQHRYKLVGNPTRVCNSDRTWTGVQPYCAEIDCGNPGPLYNGKYDIQSTMFGSIIHFQCNEGARFEGSNQTVCQEDETWSHPLPLCLSPCPVPEIENGFANETVNNDNYLIEDGNNITIICDEFYELPNFNNEQTQCKNGSWSQITSCIPARCKKLPPRPRNGFVIAPKTDHGMKARYICKDGYRLVGENTTRCHYGNWTSATPNCSVVHCTHPGNIENGKVLLVGNLGYYVYRSYITTVKNDKQILFECNKGYRILSGPTGATCVRGLWSPVDKPKCTPDKHPKLRWIRSISEIHRRRRDALRERNSLGKCREDSRLVKILRRTCSRSCLNDDDCKSHYRKCLCDGICGFTCVKPHQCPHPGTPPKGSLFLITDSRLNKFKPEIKYVSNGSELYYKCFTNYTLQGPRYATCVNHEWVPQEVPKCVPKHYLASAYTSAEERLEEFTEAPYLDVIDGGKNKDESNNSVLQQCPTIKSTKNMQLFGSQVNQREFRSGVVTVQCSEGHGLNVTSRTVNCSEGKWLPATPQCQPLYCSHPGNFENGNLVTVGTLGYYNYRPYITRLKHGKKILYECFKNYKILSGPTEATCINGRWDPPQKPKCSFENSTQPHDARSSTDDLKLRRTRSLKGSDRTEAAKKVNLQRNCQRNVRLLKILNRKCAKSCVTDSDCRSSYRKCLCDGICGHSCVKPHHCTHPGTPPKGAVFLVDDSKFSIYKPEIKQVQDGSEVYFECFTNYTLRGPRYATCVLHQWVPQEVPKCLPRRYASSDYTLAEELREKRAVPSEAETRRRRHKGVRRTRDQSERRKNRRARKGSRNRNRKKGDRNSQCPVIQSTPTMKLYQTNGNQTVQFSTGEVTVVCGGGYSLNRANKTVRCVRGRWRPLTPQCKPLKCKVPASDNGYYRKDQERLDESSDVKHGLNIEFMCKKGYKRHGVDNIRCWYGQWSTDEFPQCTPAACLLPDISNGSYVDGYRGGLAVAHGSVLTYTCDEGYLHLTSNTLLCHMGQLRPFKPNCVAVDQASQSSFASCKVPLVEDGTYHTINQELLTSQPVEHDQQVSLSCHPGFIKKGEGTIKCRYGEWATNKLPSCIPGPCNLPNIANGHYLDEFNRGDVINHGSKISYGCSDNYIPDTIGPLLCHKGELKPITPQCTASDGQVDVAASVAEIASKMAERAPSTMEGDTSGLMGRFRRPCRAPYKVENTLLFYKDNEPISGDHTDHIYQHGTQVRYRCIIGITRQRTTWTITCNDGTWTGTSKNCADDNFDLQNKSCEFRNSEPNLIAFHNDKMIVSNLTELEAGTELIFRCKDIGKFSMIGSVTRKCINGDWNGIKPACFGLSQENDYALEKPPTILFRHQLGPIAQTNDGKLLVYPGTIVHLECLWMRKYGKPEWLVSHRHRKYPEDWASESGRNENLEYRLSIYHAQKSDSGRFTCVTPMGHKHSVNIVVNDLHCPRIKANEALVVSSPNNKLNAEIKFSCRNTNNNQEQNQLSLQGPDKITCLPSGRWSDHVPTCKAPECPVWNNITLEKVSMRTVRSMDGMKLVFTCQSGYILNGSSEIWCTKNNQWPSPFPTCHPPKCPEMHNQSLGNLMMNTERNDRGLKLVFTCKPGFVLKGRRDVMCDSSGQWLQPYPTCHDVGCEKPEAPINGFIQENVDRVHKASDVVLFGCNQGYMLESKGVIVCQETGFWSAPSPKCVQACTYPGVTEGGTISVVKFHYKIGENLTFDCAPGMRLQGPKMLKCLASGLWSSAIPRCINVN